MEQYLIYVIVFIDTLIEYIHKIDERIIISIFSSQS
jgi:hypothetical protein